MATYKSLSDAKKAKGKAKGGKGKVGKLFPLEKKGQKGKI
jgi:hypothetical protein